MVTDRDATLNHQFLWSFLSLVITWSFRHRCILIAILQLRSWRFDPLASATPEKSSSSYGWRISGLGVKCVACLIRSNCPSKLLLIEVLTSSDCFCSWLMHMVESDRRSTANRVCRVFRRLLSCSENLVMSDGRSDSMYADQYDPVSGRTARTLAYCDMISPTQSTCRICTPCRCATQTISEVRPVEELMIVRTKLERLILATRTLRRLASNASYFLNFALKSSATTKILELLRSRLSRATTNALWNSL